MVGLSMAKLEVRFGAKGLARHPNDPTQTCRRDGLATRWESILAGQLLGMECIRDCVVEWDLDWAVCGGFGSASGSFVRFFCAVQPVELLGSAARGERAHQGNKQSSRAHATPVKAMARIASQRIPDGLVVLFFSICLWKFQNNQLLISSKFRGESERNRRNLGSPCSKREPAAIRVGGLQPSQGTAPLQTTFLSV